MPILLIIFEQAFADGLDIFLFGSGVASCISFSFTSLSMTAKAIYGFSALAPKPQQQCGVHHFADFAAFYNQCRLHPFAHGDKMVVYRRHGKQ